jgi:hypothetical protein
MKIPVVGRLAGVVANRTGTVIPALGALMLVAYVASIVIFPKPGGRIVFGDAIHHFVQLRSIVFDRDLDFRNEYFRLYGLRGDESEVDWVTTELTATGHVRNYMPVGPALLDLPLYVLIAGVQSALARAGLAPWPDGYERWFQTVPGVTGVLVATLAVWLSWRLARRYADPHSAGVAALAMWLGSSAIYYSLISPNYSHAASMMAAALFFFYSTDIRRAPSARRSLALGALAGLATLMRWQDAIFLSIPILESFVQNLRWRDRLLNAGVAGIGWVLAFSPQMVVWQVLYGQPFAVPQGPSFMHWSAPHLLDVLVSFNHGLFSWTPLVAFAVVGLASICVRQRALGLPLAAVLLVSWYVNSAVADWWAGEAFGARRFLSLFPLFVVGLATWLQPAVGMVGPRLSRVRVVAGVVALNLLLLFQYQLFMKGLRDVAPYPADWFSLCVARFVVPFRFLAWWMG